MQKIKIITLSLVLFTWILSFYAFFSSSERIVTHWNINGIPDGYGSRYFLFFLPVTSLISCTLTLFVQKNPQFINLPIELSGKKKERAIHECSNMLLWTNFLSTLLFLCIDFLIIIERPDFFMSIMLSILFLFMLLFIWTMYKILQIKRH